MHGISYKESRVAISQCPNSNKTNLLDTLHYILVQFNFASLDSTVRFLPVTQHKRQEK